MKNKGAKICKKGPGGNNGDIVGYVGYTPSEGTPKTLGVSAKSVGGPPRRKKPDFDLPLDTGFVRSKVTPELAVDIRRDYAAGVHIQDMVVKYELSASWLHAVASERSWGQTGRKLPHRKYLALNESGTQRIGEDHQRAKLTDAQVDEMRDLYEAKAMGYRLLAKRFEVSKRTVRDIVQYKKRNQWAGRWKKVPT